MFREKKKMFRFPVKKSSEWLWKGGRKLRKWGPWGVSKQKYLREQAFNFHSGIPWSDALSKGCYCALYHLTRAVGWGERGGGPWWVGCVLKLLNG